MKLRLCPELIGWIRRPQVEPSSTLRLIYAPCPKLACIELEDGLAHTNSSALFRRPENDTIPP